MITSALPESSTDLLHWVRRLATQTPQLTDLTAPQLEHLAQAVVWTTLRDELKRLSDLARIDYPSERRLFLENAGPTGSPATRMAYERSLNRLEAWCLTKGLSVPELKPRDADDFLYSLRAEARAPASVRLEAAGAGSFFSFLERRHDFITNPFRGSRARPANIPVRDPVVPDARLVALIIEAAGPELRAILTVLSRRGLRVGALPTMVIWQSRFVARSKGKKISGTLPPEVMEAVRQARLDERRPFAGHTARRLSDRVRRHCWRLHQSGRLPRTYSAHDLRHFYAVTEYTARPDLYRLKVLLGHSGIGVTERYLRSLRIHD